MRVHYSHLARLGNTDDAEVRPRPLWRPITSGLEIIWVRLRREGWWRSVDVSKYAYCNQKAVLRDYPHDPKPLLVRLAVFPPSYFDKNPSTADVLEEIERRGLRQPLRPAMEALFEQLMLEGRLADESRRVLGIYGSGDSFNVVSEGGPCGRVLEITDYRDKWERDSLFVASAGEWVYS